MPGALLEDRLMTKRRDVTTKMDPAVLADCRIAASFRGMTLAEYLSEAMRVVTSRDIEEGYRKRSDAASRPSKPKGGKN
jgi:hypothetical protein